MNTHSNDPDTVFCCQSYFVPKPVISLQDTIPETVKEEKKKDKGIVYLPGEKLLLSLKPKKKPLDIDRITKSLSRLLTEF